MRRGLICLLLVAMPAAACDSDPDAGQAPGPDAATDTDAPDPCEGVACDDGRPSACDGDQVVNFADQGTCAVEGGEATCRFPEESRADCASVGKVCLDGACIPVPEGPCASHVCADPPAPECDGDVARVFVTFGDCAEVDEEAVCDYPVKDSRDCAATDKVCRNGGCVEEVIDPCAPNPCTVPPAGHCTAGDDASSPPDTGTCTVEAGAAACDWSAHTATDCPEQELTCHAGACADGVAPPVAAGDVIVTELLVNPTGEGDLAEWLELYNPGTTARILDGCELADHGVDRHAIPDDAGLVVPAGGRVVLARVADTSAPGDWQPDYVYGEDDLALANTGDEVTLRCGELIVDDVAWDDTWPLESGASLSLDPAHTDAEANDEASAWCASSEPYAGTLDRGTPREPNPACPDPAVR